MATLSKPRTWASLLAALALTLGALVVPAVSAAGATSVPAYDHVFVVTMSGQSSTAMVGAAPYLSALAASGAAATAFHPVSTSSLADRLALASGQTFGVSDCLPADCPQSAATLASAVEASGRTWKAYADGMPSACASAASGDYLPELVPWVYFAPLSAGCATHVLPYGSLATDLSAASSTPNLVWIVPDRQHDMSAGGVSQGDAWAAGAIPAILASPAWTGQRSLLLVTFDVPAQQVGRQSLPLIAVASDHSVQAGYTTPAPYDEYSVLSTVERSWGLGALGAGDNAATPLTELFVSTPPTPGPTPTSTPTPAPPPTAHPTPPPPSATPSPSHRPHPTGTPGPTRRPAPSPPSSASPAPAATTEPIPSAGPGSQVASATAGSNEFIISAQALNVTDLAYVTSTTMPSGTLSNLPVLQFTATSLTIPGGLDLESPCSTQNGLSLATRMTVPSGHTVSFTGGVTLYVTSIDFTYAGAPYSYSPASPPLDFVTIASGQLTGSTMVLAQIHAGSTSLPSMQTTSFFGC